MPLYPDSNKKPAKIAQLQLQQSNERKYFDSADYSMTGEKAPVHPSIFANDGPNNLAHKIENIC